MTHEPVNGKRQTLLWFNTIATGLIFPVVILVGIRLWDKLDHNAELIIRIDERQQTVLKELPTIVERIKRLEENGVHNGTKP